MRITALTTPKRPNASPTTITIIIRLITFIMKNQIRIITMITPISITMGTMMGSIIRNKV